MIFKREISIDGVAVILATIALIVFLERINLTQEQQSRTLDEHTGEIHSLSQTTASLADSVAVLAAIVQERTGIKSPLPSPRQSP